MDLVLGVFSRVPGEEIARALDDYTGSPDADFFRALASTLDVEI